MADNESPDNVGGYTLEQQETTTNLDPELQKAILHDASGHPADWVISRESPNGVVVDVIAKLRDPKQVVPGLKISRVIGDIATGTVGINEIVSVRNNLDNIVSLKAARRVRPALRFSVPEINGSQAQLNNGLPMGNPGFTGAGVIVGIVDQGCDFAHKNFRNSDDTTRILFLWDQGAGLPTATFPAGFSYGREFGQKELNAALQSKTPPPHELLHYDLGRAAHGTHVMDIAAGNGRALEAPAPGVAPLADIIFVHLASSDVSDEDNFGNSRHLLEAIDYIFEKATALGKSAVVNLSLATNGGPHDGTNLVEQAMDHLLETPGRAIVIAAGNSGDASVHASGRIDPGQKRTLHWKVKQGDPAGSELEIWYNGDSKLNVSLVDPQGIAVGSFPLGTTTEIKFGERPAGTVLHREKDPNNFDNQVDILLRNSPALGNWLVELEVVGTKPVDFHAWIEQDKISQAVFSNAQDVDHTHTIGSLSCGENTLVVGAYDARSAGREFAPFSSAGPTRRSRNQPERNKPELSAPGVGVFAANSLSPVPLEMSGTSMAAPHVTGLVALLMQSAQQPLNIAQIRNALTASARRDPPLGGSWDPRYGLGRINALAAVRSQFGVTPFALGAGVLAETTNGGQGDPLTSLNQILATVVQSAGASRLRIKIEIEVEPPATPS